MSKFGRINIFLMHETAFNVVFSISWDYENDHIIGNGESIYKEGIVLKYVDLRFQGWSSQPLKN